MLERFLRRVIFLIRQLPTAWRRCAVVVIGALVGVRLVLWLLALADRELVDYNVVAPVRAAPLAGHYGLFVGIVSAPDHFEARHVARRTWLRYASEPPATTTSTATSINAVAHRFFVARPAMSSDIDSAGDASVEAGERGARVDDDGGASALLRRLVDEQTVYGDIVMLDTLDGYERLSFKTMAMFRWLSALHGRNCTIDFLLKTDDDSYVRIDRLLAHLRSVGERAASELYWGFFNFGATKTRVADGEAVVGKQGLERAVKWTDPTFNGTRYPPYALGAGYALAMPLVTRIALHHERLGQPPPPSRMEDASTGIYLDEAPGAVRSFVRSLCRVVIVAHAHRSRAARRSVVALDAGNQERLKRSALSGRFRSLAFHFVTCDAAQEDMVIRSHVHELALMRKWSRNFAACRRMCSCASAPSDAAAPAAAMTAATATADDSAAADESDADGGDVGEARRGDGERRSEVWRPETGLDYSVSRLRWISKRKELELDRLRATAELARVAG